MPDTVRACHSSVKNETRVLVRIPEGMELKVFVVV